MAKVTIHTKDGQSTTVDVAPEDEAFYDDLPFNSDNVIATEIK